MIMDPLACPGNAWIAQMRGKCLWVTCHGRWFDKVTMEAHLHRLWQRRYFAELWCIYGQLASGQMSSSATHFSDIYR